MEISYWSDDVNIKPLPKEVFPRPLVAISYPGSNLRYPTNVTGVDFVPY